jgi:hypothetical protein
MTDKDPEATIAEAVAAYRDEVLAEAELAHADLSELEDHLRSLIDELRTAGMPAAQAIAEAARRLGNPRAIAREHARVRTAFGARLSRLRAWSVVALMVPMLADGFASFARLPASNQLEIAFGVVVTLAMALRLTWARPILLGGVAFWAAWFVVSLVSYPAVNPAWLVAYGGMLAFLVPWRRGELTGAGLALSLQAWAFGAATLALAFQISTRSGFDLVAPAAQVAFVAAAIATAGGVLRARWSAVASVVSALTLVLAGDELLHVRFTFGGDLVHAATLVAIASGALSAVVGAVIAWRAAASRLGTLRGIAA